MTFWFVCKKFRFLANVLWSTFMCNRCANVCCHLVVTKSVVNFKVESFQSLSSTVVRETQYQVTLIHCELNWKMCLVSPWSKNPSPLDPHHFGLESSTLLCRRQHRVICDLLCSLLSYGLIVYTLVLLSVWTRSHESFPDLSLWIGLKKNLGLLMYKH